MLAIGACACLTGATSYVAIGEWAVAQGRAVQNCLDDGYLARVLPCEATLRRCLQPSMPRPSMRRLGGWAAGRVAGPCCPGRPA